VDELSPALKAPAPVAASLTAIGVESYQAQDVIHDALPGEPLQTGCLAFRTPHLHISLTSRPQDLVKRSASGIRSVESGKAAVSRATPDPEGSGGHRGRGEPYARSKGTWRREQAWG